MSTFGDRGGVLFDQTFDDREAAYGAFVRRLLSLDDLVDERTQFRPSSILSQ